MAHRRWPVASGGGGAPEHARANVPKLGSRAVEGAGRGRRGDQGTGEAKPVLDDTAINGAMKQSIDLSGRPIIGQSCRVTGLQFQVIEVIDYPGCFAVEWKRLGVISMFTRTMHKIPAQRLKR